MHLESTYSDKAITLFGLQWSHFSSSRKSSELSECNRLRRNFWCLCSWCSWIRRMHENSAAVLHNVNSLISENQVISVIVRVQLANFLCCDAVKLKSNALRLLISPIWFYLHSWKMFINVDHWSLTFRLSFTRLQDCVFIVVLHALTSYSLVTQSQCETSQTRNENLFLR